MLINTYISTSHADILESDSSQFPCNDHIILDIFAKHFRK